MSALILQRCCCVKLDVIRLCSAAPSIPALFGDLSTLFPPSRPDFPPLPLAAPALLQPSLAWYTTTTVACTTGSLRPPLHSTHFEEDKREMSNVRRQGEKLFGLRVFAWGGTVASVSVFRMSAALLSGFVWLGEAGRKANQPRVQVVRLRDIVSLL